MKKHLETMHKARHPHDTQKSIAEFWGLKLEHEPKKRKCLKCERSFYAIANRICRDCNLTNTHYKEEYLCDY